MSYALKEMFYTLQGEGAQSGRPAVFVRFAGCNLWSGHGRDRDRGPGGCSRWCDTDFVGTDGSGGGRFATATELVSAARRLWPTPVDEQVRPFAVCTGGEPLLQLDAPLLECFAAAGWDVAVETNGTLLPPAGSMWITVSPKENAPLRLQHGDELKLVYPQPGAPPERFEHLAFRHFFLQPMDGPERDTNIRSALRYCLAHPRWRLSLQTHKLLGIP